MTGGNLYDNTLQAIFASDIGSKSLQCISADAVFADLGRYFPARGSKIDWALTINHEQCSLDSPELNIFLERLLAKVGEDSCYFVGDSAMDCGYVAPLILFLSKLDAFVRFPQHHYFVEINFNWCMCITMEGDVDLGYRVRT